MWPYISVKSVQNSVKDFFFFEFNKKIKTFQMSTYFRKYHTAASNANNARIIKTD